MEEDEAGGAVVVVAGEAAEVAGPAEAEEAGEAAGGGAAPEGGEVEDVVEASDARGLVIVTLVIHTALNRPRY